MKQGLAALSFMLMAGISSANAANGKDWHNLDRFNKCARQGSPADLMRTLYSKGHPYSVSDKYKAGIVAVFWQERDGKHGRFFYPTKARCKENEALFNPAIDAKYE